MDHISISGWLRLRLRALVITAAIGALAGPASGLEQYLAVPLGSHGGTYSWGLAINNRGDIVGTAATSTGGNRAFLYSGGTMRLLGGPPSVTRSFAVSISDNGYITGEYADSQDWDRAFLHDGSSFIDLGTLGGPWSRGRGVNTSGEVAGTSRTALDPNSRAFLFRDGTMINLGTLGGYFSTGQGINGKGEVTGSAGTPNGGVRAFVYRDGVMADLGTLGGERSVGIAINERGEITGYSDTATPPPFPTPPPYGSEHAFLHSGGLMRDLGTLGGLYSHGFAINAHGQVVGKSQTAEGAMRGFLYTDGAMHDLNALVVSGLAGTSLTDAYGINDTGQIVANSCGRSDPYDCTAFRLEPIATPLAVEYYHTAYAHYFMTSSVTEIVGLDEGRPIGWTRTGQTFRTYPSDTPGTSNVCRFWTDQAFAPKSSHFYTPFDWECAIVSRNRDWAYEGQVFAMKLSDSAGRCEGATIPLYRLYNDGMGGAPNHRFTTSASLRLEMIAQGWIPEGAGLGVIGCVPAP